MFQGASVPTADQYRQRLEPWWDLAAVLLVVSVVILLGGGMRQMVAPLSHAQPGISLAPGALPLYTIRTVLRMLPAWPFSPRFTSTSATVAPRGPPAGMC